MTPEDVLKDLTTLFRVKFRLRHEFVEEIQQHVVMLSVNSKAHQKLGTANEDLWEKAVRMAYVDLLREHALDVQHGKRRHVSEEEWYRFENSAFDQEMMSAREDFHQTYK